MPVSRVRATFGTRRAAALMLIADPWMKLRIHPQETAQLGLTPTEGRVVAKLAEGISIREIADAFGRSKNTVRWQVKSALAKTGCSREAALVRVTLLARRPSAAGGGSSGSR